MDESQTFLSCGFLDPNAELRIRRRNLPHWQQDDVWCFVTWRLADSVPAAVWKEWEEERAIWLRHHPLPWDDPTEDAYHERFSRRMDEWLDQGVGSCLLRESANAMIVAAAVRHFDGDRYNLSCFVVMPNHVHVLFRPMGSHRIEAILKSWKGFTARKINERMDRRGALWQEEFWDRLVRSEWHFERYRTYIRQNPVKAKLRAKEFLWFEKESPVHGLENP